MRPILAAAFMLLALPSLAFAVSDGRIYIASAAFSDMSLNAGGSSGTSIDTAQNLDCIGDGSATTTDIEPFFDTFAAITVVNNSNRTIVMSRFWYRVRTESGTFTAKKLAFIGTGRVSAHSRVTLNAFFAQARAGSKYFNGSASPISSTLGVRNVRLYLSGRDGLRRSVTMSASTVAAFSDYDRC